MRLTLRSIARMTFTLALAAAAPITHGQAPPFEFFPGGTYDPSVPTPDAILGYPVGTNHTDYRGLERWLRAIERSPRVRILEYGRSIEGRPLYLVLLSSPENLARLDEIKAGMARLADPRGLEEAEAERIVTTLPAVAWMNHANDGNESAAFESAIQTMYQLAAGTDATTRLVLDRLVTIVNPAHNPESHERFVAWYNSVRTGPQGTADRQAAEHHAPWGLSTNNNHYQIDLNRDAFFATQPETRAIIRAFGEWNPVVFVDHHGQTKNMFFPPPAEAINPNVTANQLEWMDRYGHAIASAFDRRGWSYYRRGRFDLFYAGFWDSWPTLNGSVGMTFETDGGGSKGLAWEREDETILTLRDGVVHHHTGTMATLQLTAEQKEQRLRDFVAYKRSAIAEGAKGPLRQVVLLPGADPGRVLALVETLRLQRIEVHEAVSPFKLARAFRYTGGGPAALDVPAGAFVVSMAQPQGRLAKALLELEPALGERFLAEERRKKARADLTGDRPRDGFYDVTAWSLPLLYGVDGAWAEDAVAEAALRRIDQAPRIAPARPAAATYGYLFAGDTIGGLALVGRLLDEKFNLVVATRPFRVGARRYAAGAFLARVERNPATLHERIVALAAELGVELQALSGARVDEGPDFGEDPYVEIVRPRLAVVTDEPTAATAYGATWFTLEQRLGIGFTPIKIAQLRSGDLERYNVIVLPHGAPDDYQEALGERGIARLKQWMENGGTLVLMKGAAAFATRKGVEWTTATLKREERPVRLFFDEAGETAQPAGSAGAERDRRSQPGRAAAQPAPGGTGSGKAAEGRPAETVTREVDIARTPGAILRVKVDPEHFLGLGYEGDTVAMIASSYAFTLSKNGRHAAAFPDEASLRVAGFMWPDARAALARTLYAWEERHGRGRAIFFADDPNFRATQLSTLRMFVNAVLLGPSFRQE
jgi:hypothetical protein